MNIKVENFNHQFNDLMVVNSAKISFDKASNNITENEIKLINYLVKNNHWSPLSHPHIDIRFKCSPADLYLMMRDKYLMAGITFNSRDDDTYCITISLWSLLKLSDMIIGIDLHKLLSEKTPHCLKAFCVYNNQNSTKIKSFLFLDSSPTQDVFSFKITAPITVARQLVKHSVGIAYNEVSGRYVEFKDIYLHLLNGFREKHPVKKQGSIDNCINPKNLAEKRVKNIKSSFELYNEMLANNICPEQARGILPLDLMTSWIWTGKKKYFDRVLSLRLPSDAQKETRLVAEKINLLMERKDGK